MYNDFISKTILKYIGQGMSYEEIGKILGASEDWVSDVHKNITNNTDKFIEYSNIEKERKIIEEIHRIKKVSKNLKGFKVVKGFSRYLVNEYGKVFDTVKGVFKKQFINNVGYKYIRIKKDDGKYTVTGVHRAVALAFIPNPKNKPQVNHLDTNKKNNHISNLEWVTGEENMEHYNNFIKGIIIKVEN